MAESTKLTIGERLRAYRKAAALSQEDLAAMVKLSPESLSNIERGRQVPSLDTIRRLALALSRNPLDLVPELNHEPALEPGRAELEADAAASLRALSLAELRTVAAMLSGLARGR